jgi:hypothetical protein
MTEIFSLELKIHEIYLEAGEDIIEPIAELDTEEMI